MRAPSRRDLLKFTAAAATGTVFGAGAYGYLYERRRVHTVAATVPVPGLPAALAGLRIGLVSDLHLSPQVPVSLIEEALGRLASERCDLIAVAGDLVTWRDRRFVGPVAELVGTLSAPFGVFAALGNHDHDDLTPAALRARGVGVLIDTATRLTVRGESVFVTRGVGTVILPVRLNCPPEVAVLSLEPAAPEAAPPNQARPLRFR